METYGFDRILAIFDRAYNAGTIETFAIPMRQMGAELVVDYQARYVGIQGHYEDLIMLDGNWHVNWMPQPLIEATADLEVGYKLVSVARDTVYGASRRKKPATPEQLVKDAAAAAVIANAPAREAEVRKKIANRDRYRMIAKGLPDADGFQRFSYPPSSTDLTGGGASTRTSITIPLLIPDGASKSTEKPQPLKSLQKYTHESEDWTGHYGLRSLVEASNNLIKLASADDLGNAKKRSGRGFAFQYLASTMAAVSSNLRRIITFFEAEATRSAQKQVRARRRKNQHGEALRRHKALLTAPLAAP